MKHIAKDVYLKRDGQWSFELVRKTIGNGAKNKGEEVFTTLGYYSNMDRVWSKLKDMGYEEWVNGDLQSCRNFINEASESVKEMV